MPMFNNSDEWDMGQDEDPIMKLEGQIGVKQQLIKLLKREIEDLEFELFCAVTDQKIHNM